MSIYDSDYGVNNNTEAWRTLNFLANTLEVDYTSQAIIEAVENLIKENESIQDIIEENKLIAQYLNDISYDRNVILMVYRNRNSVR